MFFFFVVFVGFVLAAFVLRTAFQVVTVGFENYCAESLNGSCNALQMSIIVVGFGLAAGLLVYGGMRLERRVRAIQDANQQKAPKPTGYRTGWFWTYLEEALILIVLVGGVAVGVFVFSVSPFRAHESGWLFVLWLFVSILSGGGVVLGSAAWSGSVQVRKWWDHRAWPYKAWHAYAGYLSSNQLEVVIEAGPASGKKSADQLTKGAQVGEALPMN